MRLLVSPSLLLAAVVFAAPARAQHPDGAAILRLLGPRAQQAFAPPGSPGIGALVRLPAGVQAADVGLTQAAPGIARLWGTPSTLLGFADAHPDMPIEVAPPLHLLLDTARVFIKASLANDTGLDGTGALIGIADTGLDVTHPDFLDEAGQTRVAWLLDLSSPPLGKYPALEQQFGTTDSSGNVTAGAVWAAADINALLSSVPSELPQDQGGHGTLVASCAAGNGMRGLSPYRGVAPNATLIIARVAAAGSESIGNDELLRGTAFLFDRADAMQQPIVVNLSIGTDFGPHDGTMAWEETLASHVGPSMPGHALVVAAGNSGSIADNPVHQNVYVAKGATVRVPLSVPAASKDGGVQIWVAMHADASLRIGLDGPDGTWIAPVGANGSAGKTTSAYSAGIYNGSSASSSPVPSGSNGAVVLWQGAWPGGTYTVTLSGSGTADLYAEGTGDETNAGAVGWANGVREATINLPATHPAIISAGCTINKTGWISKAGYPLGLSVPDLDAVGGMPAADGGVRDPFDGEPCWFSSAGPNLLGVQKPEILAPGAVIIGAMSQQALPPSPESIFTNPSCPDKAGTGTNPDCQEVDEYHAASFGTSFSSPLVAGTVAILMQRDPTLTQDRVLAALQGGAHPLRGPAPFHDQASVGEVDVLGAVTAAERLANPQVALPAADQSWLAVGADMLLADGSTPLEAIFELRSDTTASGEPAPADGFDASRLVPYALVDGSAAVGAIASFVERGPGVWIAEVQLPAGLGGSTLTVGATFDGAPIVAPKTIAIATDSWNADYPARIEGGCVVATGEPSRWPGAVLLVLGMLGWRNIRRRRE